MAIKLALNQFNGGEISPQLEGRYDWQKYNYCSKLCKNFIPTVEGNLKRRGGTHFVALKTGEETATFKIYLKVNGYTHDEYMEWPSPTFKINGETVTVRNTGTYFLNDTFVTDELTYVEGTVLTYNATMTGYTTATGTIAVSQAQSDVTIEMYKSGGSYTADIDIIAPVAATVTLNGVEQKTITAGIGSTVSYSVSFSQQTVTGNITVTGDKTLIAYVKGTTLTVTDEPIIQSSVGSNGTIYLPACKFRYIGVGGGGGTAILGTGVYFSGGSGAGCDVILNLPEGSYDWQVGTAGTVSYDESDHAGTDTFLKTNQTYIVINGAGMVAAGGSNTLTNSYVDTVNWNLKGNTARSASGIAAASIYNGYGKGSGYNSSTQSPDYGTDGYLYLTFVEE